MDEGFDGLVMNPAGFTYAGYAVLAIWDIRSGKIGDLCQNIENGQAPSRHMQVDDWATQQKDDVFFWS